MEGLTELQIRTRSGHTQTMHVEALLSVDGKPYTDGGEVSEQIAWLSGRLDTLERLLTPQESDNG